MSSILNPRAKLLASGGYAFEGRISGTYVIAETLRVGWRRS
jgi:hypothetical protein